MYYNVIYTYVCICEPGSQHKAGAALSLPLVGFHRRVPWRFWVLNEPTPDEFNAPAMLLSPPVSIAPMPLPQGQPGFSIIGRHRRAHQ